MSTDEFKVYIDNAYLSYLDNLAEKQPKLISENFNISPRSTTSNQKCFYSGNNYLGVKTQVYSAGGVMRYSSFQQEISAHPDGYPYYVPALLGSNYYFTSDYRIIDITFNCTYYQSAGIHFETPYNQRFTAGAGNIYY